MVNVRAGYGADFRDGAGARAAVEVSAATGASIGVGVRVHAGWVGDGRWALCEKNPNLAFKTPILFLAEVFFLPSGQS